MPRMKLLHLIVASLLLVIPRIASPQTLDLTGSWQDENGSSYTVRQVGADVFWYMDGGPRVRNVFQGTIAGNNITGKWADLPAGELRNAGQLALRVESNDRMVKVGESQPYGGSVWTRRDGLAGVRGSQPAQYLGCWKDDGSRVLNTAAGADGTTVGKCVAACRDRGFRFAGVQYGSQCFCGNEYQKLGRADENACNYSCAGNNAEKCGGYWTNGVYGTGR